MVLPKQPPIVAIVGPTAVGKTALGLALARRFPMEVVSADSRQVYRGMDIGTAKPTLDQRAEVPHHVIDVVDSSQGFSLATYLAMARAAIQEIYQHGRLPLVVGGTGQYMWALLEAWRVPAVPPDPEFRHKLEAQAHEQGLKSLHFRLAKVDPQSAERIDPRNMRRVIRALEVNHQTGETASKMRGHGPAPFRMCILGLTLPRRELYRRIDQRIESIVGQGWVEEVKGLLDRGISTDTPSMSSVGYRQLAAYIDGTVTLDVAIQNIKTITHRFARQQYAWFRPADPRIRWLKAGPRAEALAYAIIEDFMDGEQ